MRRLISLLLLCVMSGSSFSQTDSLIRIGGVGDINLGTSFPSKQYLPANNNSAAIIAPVAPVLKDVDIAFGNLEGPFVGEIPPVKRCKDTTRCYIFRTPPEYFQTLVDVGFNTFSIANNHSFDFGAAGVESTYSLIDSAKLAAAGTTDRDYSIFVRDSITYGFCAFAPNRGTVSINNYSQAKRIVQHLDSIADVVIVSFHGGAEGKDRTSVPKKREIFLGEDRGDVYEFSKLVIDAGADVVFGHGPHVPRAVHLYKNRFIAFSLGNFCTYSRINVSGVNGYAPLIVVTTKPDGSFVEAQIHSFVQSYRSGISTDSQNRAAKFIKNLTLKDFPDSPLVITDSGTIKRK